MSRRKKAISREILPDPKYGDIMVARFINYLLRKGKKSVAEASFYDAIAQIEAKHKGDGLEVFKKAINNVSP
ncbi:MAG TPA: 30S ribosomal protein S7, partial [Candidatus Marinimicrobia bacterium]|nr:30S ribosomal protein S7 [Candidatus Neomarinimicrobiota bacterium]